MTLPQKKIPNPPAGPTYLPAAVSVSQKAKKDAEYHVAEKHHLEWGEKKLSSKQSFYNMLTYCTKLHPTSLKIAWKRWRVKGFHAALP